MTAAKKKKARRPRRAVLRAGRLVKDAISKTSKT